MDDACASCHRGHQFHHVNMLQDQSCLQCHVEHRGDDGLRVSTAARCVSCHGNSARMEEARGVVLPVVLRGGPENAGASAVITRFREDHPEFSPIRSKMADPNTLRFNHQKHLNAPVVNANGRPLQCADCHEEDATGEYHQRIRFTQHCQACHSLQFDPATPELQLPHGDVEFVKAFLGSLPQQYEEYARKVRDITEKRALAKFVEDQMKRVEGRQIVGESFVADVFLSRNRRQPPNGAVAPFYGCAYCHEVTRNGAEFAVSKAVVPVRWLNKGAFHHRQHQNVSCTTCHNAARSVQTSDILLPSVKTCAACHRSNAAPGDSCTLCHQYHHWKEQLLSTAR